jgi:hypothetical protein
MTETTPSGCLLTAPRAAVLILSPSCLLNPPCNSPQVETPEPRRRQLSGFGRLLLHGEHSRGRGEAERESSPTRRGGVRMMSPRKTTKERFSDMLSETSAVSFRSVQLASRVFPLSARNGVCIK